MELNHQKQRLQTEIDELKNELRQAHKTLDFEKFWTLLDAHPLINAKKAQINLIEILIHLRTAQQLDKNSRGSDVLISRPVSDLCDRIDLFEIALKALSNRLSLINRHFLSDEVLPEHWAQLASCRTKFTEITENLAALNSTPVYRFRGLNITAALNWSHIFELQTNMYDCSKALDQLENAL